MVANQSGSNSKTTSRKVGPRSREKSITSNISVRGRRHQSPNGKRINPNKKTVPTNEQTPRQFTADRVIQLLQQEGMQSKVFTDSVGSWLRADWQDHLGSPRIKKFLKELTNWINQHSSISQFHIDPVWIKLQDFSASHRPEWSLVSEEYCVLQTKVAHIQSVPPTGNPTTDNNSSAMITQKILDLVRVPPVSSSVVLLPNP